MATSATTGVGFIAFAPVASSNGTSVRCTTSLYAGDTSTAFATSGTGISAIIPVGGLSTDTDFSSAFAVCKPAIASLRVRYIGTELERGGRLYLFNDQEDFTVIGMTPNDILSRPLARSIPVTREWAEVTTFTLNPRLTTFLNTAAPWDFAKSPTSTGSSSPLLCLALAADALTSVAFEFETVFHFETRIQTLSVANKLDAGPKPSDEKVLVAASQIVTQVAGHKTTRLSAARSMLGDFIAMGRDVYNAAQIFAGMYSGNLHSIGAGASALLGPAPMRREIAYYGGPAEEVD